MALKLSSIRLSIEMIVQKRITMPKPTITSPLAFARRDRENSMIFAVISGLPVQVVPQLHYLADDQFFKPEPLGNGEQDGEKRDYVEK